MLEYKKINEKEYTDELILLFNSVFGTNATNKTWNYKHYLNPLSPSGIFGAFDGNKLVGMNAFMPMLYSCDNKEYKVVQSCESAVNPKYRRRGIFSGIITIAEKYYFDNGYDYFIGFPNVENSYGGFLKIGWRTEGQVVRGIKVLNPLKAGFHLIFKNQNTPEFANTDHYTLIKPSDIPVYGSTYIRPNFSNNYFDWKLGNFGYKMVGHYSDRIMDSVIVFNIDIKKNLRILDIKGVYSIMQNVNIVKISRDFIETQKSLFDIAIIWIEEKYERDLRAEGFCLYRAKKLPFIAKKINISTDDVRWEPMYMESDVTISING